MKKIFRWNFSKRKKRFFVEIFSNKRLKCGECLREKFEKLQSMSVHRWCRSGEIPGGNMQPITRSILQRFFYIADATICRRLDGFPFFRTSGRWVRSHWPQEVTIAPFTSDDSLLIFTTPLGGRRGEIEAWGFFHCGGEIFFHFGRENILREREERKIKFFRRKKMGQLRKNKKKTWKTRKKKWEKNLNKNFLDNFFSQDGNPFLIVPSLISEASVWKHNGSRRRSSKRQATDKQLCERGFVMNRKVPDKMQMSKQDGNLKSRPEPGIPGSTSFCPSTLEWGRARRVPNGTPSMVPFYPAPFISLD